MPAVTSEALVGRAVDWHGLRFEIGEDALTEWVECRLPAQGVPKGYYAWQREGDLYLGELEDELSWPGFCSERPGERLPLYFDPLTGKLAYPFLRPHFGKRP